MSDTTEDTVANERWLPVPGYEGFYEVSDLGRVRSLDRVVFHPVGGASRRRGKVLRQAVTPANRRAVNLLMDSKTKGFLVHRLVLMAFVGAPPEGHECLHWDNDPTNNHLDNLRWGTRSENVHDQVRQGVHRCARNETCDRGHSLVMPNLRQRGEGIRTCLACSRARLTVAGRLARGSSLSTDVDRIAHENYRKIMNR